MIEFDDLTAEQKAALTEEQIQHYIRVHAMEEGVPLVHVDIGDVTEEPDVNLSTQTVYKIEHLSGSSLGIVFDDRTSAEQFLGLDYRFIFSKYIGGSWRNSWEYTDLPSGAKIVEDQLPTAQEISRNIEKIKRLSDIRDANTEVREACDSRERTLGRLAEHIRSEVRDARAEVQKRQNVRATWAEYQELAKDHESAVTCMRRAYPDQPEFLSDVLGDGWDHVAD